MKRIQSFGLLFLTTFAPFVSAQEPNPRVLEEIRAEAIRSNHDPVGRPLPLAAHWNGSGVNREGFSPEYQLKQIGRGRHILPWLLWPPTDFNLAATFKPGDARRQKYVDDRLQEYEPIVKELARLKLPISFLATQWESVLSYDRQFFELPADKNPNVVLADGTIQKRVCPFGPVEPWREAGRLWTDNQLLRQIQEWYPDPPLVVLISNNEHAKLAWNEVETSPRYLAKYGAGKSDDFQRQVVGDGWIERYSAMIGAMRDGLKSDVWKRNVKFVGYEAFPPVHFGRWGGWKEYSLYSPGRLDPQPLYFDGASPSYYLHNWMALTDYTLWSPQIETMNWVFMLQEVEKIRPEFWFELSTWDGNVPGVANDKRMFYARQGQPYSPERYAGLVQYGMWLTRPRVVREFRSHLETVEYAGPYFDPILDAVDRIYTNATLQKFWRHGTLVVNRAAKHPYQADIPKEFQSADRWYLLDTNLTPPVLKEQEFDNANPPERQTEISVFALAMSLGEAPKREWLVFAHAPREARLDVQITLPEFGPITVDVPQEGSFFVVDEATRATRTLLQGGPASLHVKAPTFLTVGAEATFTASEPYMPKGKLDQIVWGFGDGKTAEGFRVTHRYDQPGQYFVRISGRSGDVEALHLERPLFVDLPRDEGLVCRLLMKGAALDGMKSWIWGGGGWDKVDYHQVPDASGRNNVGFLAGGAWVDDPQRGTVLELNGQRDRIEINNTADINTAASYPERTVALWYKAALLSEPATPAKPLPNAKPAPPPRQVIYEEGGSGNGLNLYLDGSTLTAGAWSPTQTAWLKHDGARAFDWHHVALVFGEANEDAAGTMRMYVDGKEVATGAATIGAHPADINLGRSGSTRFPDRNADQPAHYFTGRLDDFRLYNRALSAAEISELVKPKN